MIQKIQCKFCQAKPKVKNAVFYAGHQMCQECRYEYQAVFEGKISKQFEATRGDNPLEEKHIPGLDDLKGKCDGL